MGEELFLSKQFSLALVALHIFLLGLFVATGWLRPSGSSLPGFLRNLLRGRQRTVVLSKSFIMTVVLTSLAIGLLCARSLHYQFFAYLSWATPFLLWRAGFHPILIYVIWALQEWGWNVYPSTNTSSSVVVFSLGVQVFGVHFNSRNALSQVPPKRNRKEHTQ